MPTPTRPQRKRATETRAARHVSVYTIHHPSGNENRANLAGTITIASPIGGNGMGAALADVHIFAGPLAFNGNRPGVTVERRDTYMLETGSAGGCGYAKGAAAVVDAFMREKKADPARFDFAHLERSTGDDSTRRGEAYEKMTHGGGFSPIRDYLGALGYVVIEVL